jgi:hypothetical protein
MQRIELAYVENRGCKGFHVIPDKNTFIPPAITQIAFSSLRAVIEAFKAFGLLNSPLAMGCTTRCGPIVARLQTDALRSALPTLLGTVHDVIRPIVKKMYLVQARNSQQALCELVHGQQRR